MTTKFIGVREFRQNISGLYKKAKDKNIRYVVLNKNKPVFEVKPLSEKEIYTASFIKSVAEGEADARAGRVHTLKEVMKSLGM